MERQIGELNRNIQILQNEKKSHQTIAYQLQQDLKSVQDKRQLAEDEKMRAQKDAAKLRDQVSQRLASCLLVHPLSLLRALLLRGGFVVGTREVVILVLQFTSLEAGGRECC